MKAVALTFSCGGAFFLECRRMVMSGTRLPFELSLRSSKFDELEMMTSPDSWQHPIVDIHVAGSII